VRVIFRQLDIMCQHVIN